MAKCEVSLVGQSCEAEFGGLKITLRHWQPGDRFQPIGQAGTA